MAKKLPLQQELEYFEKNKPQLVKRYGNQWIVIKGEEVSGGYSDQPEAFSAGVAKYGEAPFLIKLAASIEDPPATIPALWFRPKP